MHVTEAESLLAQSTVPTFELHNGTAITMQVTLRLLMFDQRLCNPENTG